MTDTPPELVPPGLDPDRLLVLGKMESVGVEAVGELRFIRSKVVATSEVVTGEFSRGRSVGGRGAGPGFMN